MLNQKQKQTGVMFINGGNLWPVVRKGRVHT